MITIQSIIDKIKTRQPVLNEATLGFKEKQKTVSGVASLKNATNRDIAFLADKKYLDDLKSTKAAIVLVTEHHVQDVPASSICLVVKSPYLAFASISQLFSSENQAFVIGSLKGDANTDNRCNIHPTAVIAKSAVIADDVVIGAFCVIGEGVRIAQGCRIHNHVSIGNGVSIGENCLLESQVVIGNDCHLAHDVRIHAHASIGSEGFGFAPTQDVSQEGWERIAQLGRVIIGHHVRIGSQTCIDRGAVDDTVIGNHVIIDNLVQIAHNVEIGDGTAIAAKTGIAGSTKIGKRCIIGGAAGINGHLNIADDVIITGMAMVTKSIRKSGSYSSGVPAMPTEKWRKAAVRFRQLD